MRQAIEGNFDSSVLYQNLSIPESDCFGKLFDTHEIQCHVCAASSFCQAFIHKKNQELVKSLNKQKPFFDLVNFDLINSDELLIVINEGIRTKEEILEIIMQITNANKTHASYWFDIFCLKNSVSEEMFL